MASVIASARRSTTSAFDLVTSTALTLNQTVAVASLSIDALHAKAKQMHRSVVRNCAFDMELSDRRELIQAANDHVDFLEDIFKRNNPTATFDRDASLKETITQLEAVLPKHPE